MDWRGRHCYSGATSGEEVGLQGFLVVSRLSGDLMAVLVADQGVEHQDGGRSFEIDGQVPLVLDDPLVASILVYPGSSRSLV